jgi:hypothetical protein
MAILIVLLTFFILPFSWANAPRVTSTPLPYPNSTAAFESGLTLKILSQQAAANTRAKLAARGHSHQCNLKTVSIHKEW